MYIIDLADKQVHVQWVSEWLLFNANSAIFQLYHDKNKLIFNEMMMYMYNNIKTWYWFKMW